MKITSATLLGGAIFTPGKSKSTLLLRNSTHHDPALVLALAYTYSQDNPNRKITYFIVTFRIKWLPYVMLLMTFIMQSPESALHQGSGLVAAHLYDFLTRIWPTFGGGSNVIWTPQFVQDWFVAAGLGRSSTTRPYGTAFSTRAPAASASGGSSRGVTSGFSSLTSGWGGRGAGRRLGGD